MKYTVDELLRKKESQTFDRKSARKDPKGLSNHIVAFANADGGILVIGIEDDLTITGIDDYQKNINDILRVSFDYCNPSVMINTEMLDCIDNKGKPNHILLINIPQSPELHANQQDEVYYRMGDKSKKLNFDERLQLMYSKGSRLFEDEPVADSTINDIDLSFVKEYCHKIGYSKSAEEYIRQNKNFIVNRNGKEEMSGAAILLFGKEPQQFFKRARVRFIRYEGIDAKVGTEMNVIKDMTFNGRILDVVKDSLDFVKSQIKEHTYLANDGKFTTVPEYPEFAWKELVINAIAHRDYSIKGTDIQIKMFDDRIVVESPGMLPGLVRLNNIRSVHFSRNPKIAEYLHEYNYVQEFGEGVDRLFREMESAGLPEPEYHCDSFILSAIIKNAAKTNDSVNDSVNESVNKNELKVYELLKKNPSYTREDIKSIIGVSVSTVDRALRGLNNKGKIKRVGSDKTGHWEIIE